MNDDIRPQTRFPAPAGSAGDAGDSRDTPDAGSAGDAGDSRDTPYTGDAGDSRDTPRARRAAPARGSRDAAARDLIVLRISEIFLKGRNRKTFWDGLIRNARRLVRDLPGVHVESHYLRAVVVHPPELRAACIERLSRLFGLASMAPATRVIAADSAPERIVASTLAALADVAVARAAAGPADQTFKIETRRRDKSFPLTSHQISQHVGGEVHLRTGRPVDVHHPAEIIRIETGPQTYVYDRFIPGPGGLPAGTTGNVALLLSGGIDSPVAGWMAMRRGCHISPIYFHSFPYTGDKTKEKVLDLARKLAAWQGRTAVHIVHFTDVQKALREHARADLAVLAYRRMMMRVASILAVQNNWGALVTGENLGQVASQTLENLAVIEDAASLPVLRPLIMYNKADIVKEAQRIDTYDLSILPYDDCCSLFTPKHPATRARIKDLTRAETGLDIDAMALTLAEHAERVVLD